jgi:hypothetical protein
VVSEFHTHRCYGVRQNPPHTLECGVSCR